MNVLSILAAGAVAAPETTKVGNPWVNIGIFGLFVAVTLIVVLKASSNNKTAADYYAGGRSFTGTQNGTAIAGDYLSAASFLGIVGAIADQRLRRLPLLDRLPGRLAGGPAAGRRTAAQHRQVHHGRRALLPPEAAPGAHRRGRLHPGGLRLLPAGPDGRRRRAGFPAAGHRRPAGPVPGHRRGRRADDHLRADRRHEGHHLGADHQGLPADRRRVCHDDHGAGAVRLQLLRTARCRRRQSAGTPTS